MKRIIFLTLLAIQSPALAENACSFYQSDANHSYMPLALCNSVANSDNNAFVQVKSADICVVKDFNRHTRKSTVLFSGTVSGKSRNGDGVTEYLYMNSKNAGNSGSRDVIKLTSHSTTGNGIAAYAIDESVLSIVVTSSRGPIYNTAVQCFRMR